MGIFFQPDMTTSTEVPAVEAVLLLQRQIQAASEMMQEEAPREFKRGDVDQPRQAAPVLPHYLRR